MCRCTSDWLVISILQFISILMCHGLLEMLTTHELSSQAATFCVVESCEQKSRCFCKCLVQQKSLLVMGGSIIEFLFFFTGGFGNETLGRSCYCTSCPNNNTSSMHNMFGASVSEVYNIIWCQFDLKIDNVILMIGKRKKKRMVVYRKIIEQKWSVTVKWIYLEMLLIT